MNQGYHELQNKAAASYGERCVADPMIIKVTDFTFGDIPMLYDEAETFDNVKQDIVNQEGCAPVRTLEGMYFAIACLYCQPTFDYEIEDATNGQMVWESEKDCAQGVYCDYNYDQQDIAEQIARWRNTPASQRRYLAYNCRRDFCVPVTGVAAQMLSIIRQDKMDYETDVRRMIEQVVFDYVCSGLPFSIDLI